MSIDPLPTGDAAGDMAEVTRLLTEGLIRLRGRRLRVTALQARPVKAASSHPISHLVVTLDGTEQLPVIFKRLRPHPARVVHREVLVYRHLLGGGRFGAPALYGAVCDQERGRYWLLMEDVGSWRLQWCAVPEWRRALQWLARMHATGPAPDELAGAGYLDRHDGEFYADLTAAAVTSLQAHRMPAAARRLGRLAERHLDGGVEVLTAQPRTLVHGDLSCHNLLVQQRRFRPVDWEWAAAGTAAWDVAKLLAGWGSGTARLLGVYVAERARAGGPVDPGRFAEAVAQCAAMQRLWYLAWWTDACDDPDAVQAMLDRVQHTWLAAR